MYIKLAEFWRKVNMAKNRFFNVNICVVLNYISKIYRCTKIKKSEKNIYEYSISKFLCFAVVE